MYSAFSMKELGLLNYFVGISVASSSSSYILSQQKYVFEILAKDGMRDYKPYSSPIATKVATSKFLENPLNSHFAAVKRLLKYLKGTLSHGLHFTTGPLVLNAFSDSDYAGNVPDRRSTTGYCVLLGPHLVSRCTKKQPTISRS
ncbi:uncharacterized protein LOC114300411 [Camellia sinensis]|uniref:uncharacterized protein LOC114300411 n=1 Tax=Camellia sinensis TaxID=4442 RepID=UPI0010359873|nr:uncharacterized protein LOC114300411 [Camellia sinensis]